MVYMIIIFGVSDLGYHNAYSSIEKIKEFANNKDYLTISSSDKPNYNYSIDDIDLISDNIANDIYIKYSTLHNVQYKYSLEDKVYYRWMRGIEDKDKETDNQYYAKNIVIMYVNNYTLSDGETKGRQELENTGTGEGLFITNGKYINITWKKASSTSKTLWLDQNGEEIVLNDGITYVQIVPLNYKVEIN